MCALLPFLSFPILQSLLHEGLPIPAIKPLRVLVVATSGVSPTAAEKYGARRNAMAVMLAQGGHDVTLLVNPTHGRILSPPFFPLIPPSHLSHMCVK